MPRREDLETIMVLGSGPIKIGQAAEFDFSARRPCGLARGRLQGDLGQLQPRDHSE